MQEQGKTSSRIKVISLSIVVAILVILLLWLSALNVDEQHHQTTTPVRLTYLERKVPIPINTVVSLAWNANSTQLASAVDFMENKVSVWDVQQGILLFSLMHDEPISVVTWNPTKNLIATAGRGSETIYIWNVGTLKLEKTLDTEVAIWGIDWSPNGDYIAMFDLDNSVQIHEIATGTLVATFTHPKRVLGGYNDVAWNPKSDRVALADGDGSIAVWNVQHQQLLSTIEFTYLSNLFANTVAVAWSPDGNKLAGQNWNGRESTIEIWNVETLKTIVVLDERDDNVRSGLAWSPDSTKLATMNSREMVKIWDAQTGTLLVDFPTGISTASLAWSPDGNRIAVGSLELIQIWNVSNLQNQ